jgi:hypothetical protein
VMNYSCVAVDHANSCVERVRNKATGLVPCTGGQGQAARRWRTQGSPRMTWTQWGRLRRNRGCAKPPTKPEWRKVRDAPTHASLGTGRKSSANTTS